VIFVLFIYYPSFGVESTNHLFSSGIPSKSVPPPRRTQVYLTVPELSPTAYTGISDRS